MSHLTLICTISSLLMVSQTNYEHEMRDCKKNQAASATWFLLTSKSVITDY